MLCYRDRTYCASDCLNRECSRFVSKHVEMESKRLNLPLALSDFSKRCPDYQKPLEVQHDR